VGGAVMNQRDDSGTAAVGLIFAVLALLLMMVA
jgi:hypothetical protein